MAGRPVSDIGLDQVVEMRSLGFDWVRIASFLGVHVNTLSRWRTRNNFDGGPDDPILEVSDDELDNVLRDFLDNQPQRGQMICGGHLTDLGIKCSDQRLRVALGRIDAEGRTARGQRKHKRVEYNVFRPHHLWHHDGWHKLTQRCGIVVHACIDGATRKGIYAVAADNNRADTVLRIFMDATGPSGHNMLPSRLRGDRGGENRRVAEYMIDKRGLDRGSYLAGASWQNQRIESYWRFLNSQCLGYYIGLVKSLTKARKYDPSTNADRWVFQFLFLPVINEELQMYLAAWNNHKIRTEKYHTPLQLEYLLRGHFPPPVSVDEDNYGVELDDDDAEERVDRNQVYVEEVNCDLNAGNKALFQYHYSPRSLEDCKDEFAAYFCDACNYYNELIHAQDDDEQNEENNQG